MNGSGSSVRRRLGRAVGAVSAVALAGASLVAFAAPASADVYKQKCVDARAPWGSFGTICVSYNYTSRTAAANLQNCCAIRGVDLYLRDAGGHQLASFHDILLPDEWAGIFKRGVGFAHYCAAAGITTVCL